MTQAPPVAGRPPRLGSPPAAFPFFLGVSVSVYEVDELGDFDVEGLLCWRCRFALIVTEIPEVSTTGNGFAAAIEEGLMIGGNPERWADRGQPAPAGPYARTAGLYSG